MFCVSSLLSRIGLQHVVLSFPLSKMERGIGGEVRKGSEVREYYSGSDRFLTVTSGSETFEPPSVKSVFTHVTSA